MHKFVYSCYTLKVQSTHYHLILLVKLSSKENDRVTLKVVDQKMCKVEIKNVTTEDDGLWSFTTVSGSKNTQKEYSHNVSVKIQGG